MEKAATRVPILVLPPHTRSNTTIRNGATTIASTNHHHDASTRQRRGASRSMSSVSLRGFGTLGVVATRPEVGHHPHAVARVRTGARVAERAEELVVDGLEVRVEPGHPAHDLLGVGVLARARRLA